MTKVAFFGSHPLGERCLRLLDEHTDIDVDVVVTYPLEYESWWEGSVHKLAKEMGYEVLLTDDEAEVRAHDVDYIISVYYPNILPSGILNHANIDAVNLHQAELPRYRGSNVFSHSIMNAREDDHWKHGTTLHVMDPEVDAGAIIDRRFTKITEDDTARSLYEKVRETSVDLFRGAIEGIADKTLTEEVTPQDELPGKRYFYSKDSLDGLKEIPQDELVEADNQQELYDRIRALDFPPHEPAWTTINDKKVYLTKSGYGK